MLKQLGEYQVNGKLGEGGMGTVYSGYQPSLDREVALKTLSDKFADNETFVARFLREARAAASLVHPNVIQVFSIGCEQGMHYFAMEYVRGMDVAEHLAAGRQFTFEETLDIITQVVQALVAAGEAGLVHRDIKPSNIMLTDKGLVKMTDFGLAKTLDSDLTEVGTVVGTANYMSPEQGQGLHLDARSDIYSLGVVFFELVTGQPPFTADSAPAVLYKHVYEPPPRPRLLNSEIPPPLEAIVLKMLQKDPESRPASAEALLAELHQLRLALKEGAPTPAAPVAELTSPQASEAVQMNQSASAVLEYAALFMDGSGQVPAGIHAALQEKRFRVQTVDTASDAVEQALSQQPDLLLVDMDALDESDAFLNRLAEQGVKSRLIVIATPRRKEALQQEAPYPICGYLTKPINAHELRSRIDAVMESPAPATGNIDKAQGLSPQVSGLHADEDKRFLLVCTYQPYSQILFRQLLEAEGHQVACTDTANDALTILREDPPDLVVLEIRRDDGERRALIQTLKQNNPTLPLLLVLNEQDEDLTAELRTLTTGPILTKPVRLEAVRQQVQKALESSQAGVRPVLCSGTYARLVSHQRVRDQVYTVFDFARSLLPVVPKPNQPEYLQKIQDDPARQVCNLIASVLRNLTRDKGEETSMRFIRHAYRHGNFETRNLCLVLLREVLEPAEELAVLLKIVTDEDFRMRMRVLSRMGELGDASAAEIVVRFLNDDIWKVRTAAAECLEMLGGAAVIEPLVHYYARTGNPLPDRLRKIVLEGQSQEKITQLEKMAQTGPALVRAYVIRLMGEFRSRQTIPLLIELLQDKQSAVRSAAADTLGRMRNDKSLLGLFNALADSSADVQRSVVQALLNFQLTSGTTLLIKALGGRERRIAPEAIRFLLQLNRSSKELERSLANLERESAENRKYLSLLLSTAYGEQTEALQEMIRRLNAADKAERERSARQCAEFIRRAQH